MPDLRARDRSGVSRRGHNLRFVAQEVEMHLAVAGKRWT